MAAENIAKKKKRTGPVVVGTIKSHYMLLEHKASECISCQACESRCPFGVPVAERMKKTVELFGC